MTEKKKRYRIEVTLTPDDLREFYLAYGKEPTRENVLFELGQVVRFLTETKDFHAMKQHILENASLDPFPAYYSGPTEEVIIEDDQPT